MKEENGMTASPVQPIVSPFYDRGGITIYNADCRDVLPMLGKFDLLLTDPPYGMNAFDGSRTTKRFTINRSRNWDCQRISSEAMQMIRDHGESQIIWGGNYYADVLPIRKSWLCWRKPDAPRTMADFELAWTSLEINGRHIEHSIAATNAERVGHPSQKPLRVMKWCIALAGDITSIIDPFMGSGSTLVAAKLNGIRAVGIEISEEYCQKAVERLRQGVLDFGSEG